MRSRRRCSRCGWEACSRLAGGCAGRRSSPLGGPRSSPTPSPRPRLPGERRRAGTRRAFRVYYLFGGLLTAPLLGLGSLLLTRRRWALWPALVYVGLAIGVAIAVPVFGECGLEHPGGPGPPRFLPGPARRSRRQHRRHGGRRSCGNCHDQAPATRKRARPRGRRCCRRWNRSIRLGSGENGCFCGNCSTSSLRRIYSFVALQALTNRYGPRSYRDDIDPGARPGSSLGRLRHSPSGEPGLRTRGFSCTDKHCGFCPRSFSYVWRPWR